MGLCVLWGLTISSMFILSFLKNISLTTREENAIALVERLESSKKMQYLAGEMIRKIA